MDYYQALQVSAMAAVLHPDRDAFLRHVKRFYSKNFNTPLAEVDDLDEEFVLRSYYEEAFTMMDEDGRYEYLDTLMATPEEKAERLAALEGMEARDLEFMKKLNEDVKKGKRRGPPPERKKPQMPTGPVDPKERAKAIRDRIARGITTPEEPKAAAGPPPDISMKFEPEDGNLEGVPAAWLDMDPSGSPSPKK